VPPRRPHGTTPAAFSKTGQDVPPSPEVAAQGLAEVIGGTVAYSLAQLLGPVLQRLVDVQEHYACIVCSRKTKSIAVANARAAAEHDVEVSLPRISQAFTEGKRGPVCWSCFDPDAD
jgi:hypothetical protein